MLLILSRLYFNSHVDKNNANNYINNNETITTHITGLINDKEDNIDHDDNICSAKIEMIAIDTDNKRSDIKFSPSH